MDKRYDHMISKYHHRFLEERFKSLKINRSEAPYLKIIYISKEIKMNDLIAKFFFHKSHTTRVIKSLVNDGYVDKVIDPEDKRGFILSITEKGKKIAQTIIEVLDEWDQLMSSFLNQQEKEFLAEIHKKVYLRLREYFQEDSLDE